MATIKIKTKQIDIETGTELSEEYSYDGTFSKKKNLIYIRYDDKDPENGSVTNNSITVKDKSVSRMSRGQSSSIMNFKEGIETTTNYVTPYGTFPMRFVTKYINISNDGTDIKIEYTLCLDERPYSECELHILISD